MTMVQFCGTVQWSVLAFSLQSLSVMLTGVTLSFTPVSLTLSVMLSGATLITSVIVSYAN